MCWPGVPEESCRLAWRDTHGPSARLRTYGQESWLDRLPQEIRSEASSYVHPSKLNELQTPALVDLRTVDSRSSESACIAGRGVVKLA